MRLSVQSKELSELKKTQRELKIKCSIVRLCQLMQRNNNNSKAVASDMWRQRFRGSAQRREEWERQEVVVVAWREF